MSYIYPICFTLKDVGRKFNMIRSYIGSTQECGVVFKLDEFSHLIG